MMSLWWWSWSGLWQVQAPPAPETNVVYALVAIIVTLVGILGFVIRNELQRVRTAQHRLANKVHFALMMMSVMDEKYKKMLDEDEKEGQRNDQVDVR